MCIYPVLDSVDSVHFSVKIHSEMLQAIVGLLLLQLHWLLMTRNLFTKLCPRTRDLIWIMQVSTSCVHFMIFFLLKWELF